MTWASWTTIGIHARRGTVRTVEAGVLEGDVTLHTTWSDGEAHIAVQYSGANDWYTLEGSPVPCHSEEDSRSFHQAVVEAVRGEEGAPALDQLFSS
ncbi:MULTISPECIES: hypothetical protein [unclassified Streptomyces]|uniref:hypothetical protein n=1 Tax=unclassified Streptomyces TaxID=2593676 RepID=UPI00381626C7